MGRGKSVLSAADSPTSELSRNAAELFTDHQLPLAPPPPPDPPPPEKDDDDDDDEGEEELDPHELDDDPLEPNVHPRERRRRCGIRLTMIVTTNMTAKRIRRRMPIALPKSFFPSAMVLPLPRYSSPRIVATI